MRHPVIILTILMILTGCGAAKHQPTVIYRDSVSVVYRDSTVYRIDTIKVAIPREESSAVIDTPEPSHLETSMAESDAYVDESGKLHHTLRNKFGEKLLMPVPIPEHFLSVNNTEKHIATHVETVEVEKKLNFFQKFFMLIGKLATVLLVLSALFFVARFFLKGKLLH